MSSTKDLKEIEKEMDKCKIITLGDIYRALREHPEWLQELRRIILTEELLELPRKFQKFIEEEFHPLKEKVNKIDERVDKIEEKVDKLEERVDKLEEKVDKINERVIKIEKDVSILKEDVDILKKEMAKVKEDVEKLKIDVGWLKGGMMELQVRDRVGAIFGKILKKAKLVDFSDIADTLYDAVEEKIISIEEAEEVLRLDAVVRGFLRKDELKEVLIASEISFVVDKEDIERAVHRAKILSKVYKSICIPAAIGRELTEGAREMADKLDVLLI